MRKAAFLLMALCLSSGCVAEENPRVQLETSFGDVVVELYADKAPISVENFLAYVEQGAYDGPIFHRVIPDFMVQAGGYEPGLKERDSGDPITNEADNGLKNTRGTIAMARMAYIDSARRQFFINGADNPHLDHGPESCTREDRRKQQEASQKGLYKPLTCKSFGYAVFGEVVDGMDVIDKIETVETATIQGFANVPVEPVIIERVTVVES
ncbi:MAG: peptidyl-prolyl cis-trans isomerase [Pseudomonadales bacterium]|nr:peptidyl-prolyl cis-trans isomerase [Pseudomonadales bacterium]